MTTANGVGPGMRAPWQRLLGMAMGLIVTAVIAVPAAAQTSAGIMVSPATSTTSRLETTEAGGTAEFTVTLATGPTANVVLDVASSDTSRGTVLPASLTFTSTTWNAAQTVTLTGVNDDPPDFLSNPPIPNHSIGKKDYQVTLTVNQMATGDARYDAISSETVYAVNADDEYDLDVPVVVAGGLTVEEGTTETFTVELTRQPTANVTVTIESRDTTEGTVSPTRLIFTSTTWNMAQNVSVTGVEDNVNDGSMTWTVRLDPSSTDMNYFSQETGMGGMTSSPRLRKEVQVLTTDSDDLPTVTLAVSTTSIAENGGEATVTAELSGQSTEAVTLTVTTPPMPADYTQNGMTLIIAARQTTSTGTVTVTAVDNLVDAPDKQVTVSATATGGRGVSAPSDVTLTITDDDATPTVTLAVSPAAITEAAGVATVTATLNRASSAVTTLTVAAAAVPPAVAGDFTQSGTVLTISAGQTTSTGTVTVTAVDNLVYAPDKQVTVSATATGGRGVSAPSDVTLTITDDDEGPGLEIVPTVLALEERTTDPQQAKPYTVRLKTQPTAAVTVEVEVDEDLKKPFDNVTFAPMFLTFDASNWDTAQTVTVTALRDEGNDGNDEVTLKHMSAGASEYASLGPDQHPIVTVRVTDVDPPPVLKVFEMGDDLKCELQDLAENFKMAIEALDKEVECTLVDVTSKEERDVRTVAGLFSLGTDTAHMVVDIDPTSGDALKELDEVLDNGLRVDMAVPPSLQNDAKNIDQKMLHLLHLDNKEDVVWKEVGSGDVGANEISSEKPLESFFRFALAFENLKPKFDKEEQALTFMTGIARSEELPVATGGNPPLTYTLTAETALPPGLEHDQRNREDPGMITGTPTTPTTEPQAYTLIVRDKNGDDDTLKVTIEVTSGIQSRDLALVLAGVGRTLAADVVEILGGRFSSSPSSRLQVTLGGQALRLTSPPAPAHPSPSSPTPSPLAGEGQGEGAVLQGEGPLRQVDPQKAGGSSSGSLQRATGLALGVARAIGITLDLPSSSPSPLPGEGRGEGDLLQNNAPLLGRVPTDRSRSTTPSNLFRLQPVSARDLLAHSAFELPLTRTGGDGVPVWTLWGRGSAAGFSGQPEDDFKMDGTLYSGYVGVDYRPQSTVLLGLAVSHSTGEANYERIGATKAGVDVELTSMLPYAHWQPRPGLGLWSLLGVGWGDLGIKVAGDTQTRHTALTSYLVAVGGRQALTTWQGIDLAAKTDAFLTTVQSKGKTNLPVARGHAQRMRLLMEGRTAVEVSSVSRLSPYMQLGGRWDSGTAEQGLGAELGGGVAYTRTDLGLSVEAQGRYLLVHEDGAFEDWGASVNVRVDPGVAGRGAYLTVSPVWGQAASGVDQLWGNAAGMPQVVGNATMPAAGWRPHRLAVDVGYGLALADGHGFLTPYGGLALAGPGSSRYRLGSRLALSSSLAVTLEGERAEQPGQETAHGVSVRLGWQW